MAATTSEARFSSPSAAGENSLSGGDAHLCGSASASDEEWAKIADAVERRRIQNRNAQRKYRKTLKQRAEELKRRKSGKARTSNSNSGQSSPKSQETISGSSSVLYLCHDEHPVPFNSPEAMHTSDMSDSLPGIVDPTATWLRVDDHFSMSEWNLEPSVTDPNAKVDALMDQLIPNPEVLGYSSSSSTTQPDSWTIGLNADGDHSSGASSIRSLPNDYGENATTELGSGLRLGRTTLHIAAMKGNQSMTRLLLAKGADPNARDSDGWTPLHVAVDQGHQKVVDLLLEGGANLYATTDR